MNCDFWSGLWNELRFFGLDWGMNWHAMYVRRDPVKRYDSGEKKFGNLAMGYWQSMHSRVYHQNEMSEFYLLLLTTVDRWSEKPPKKFSKFFARCSENFTKNFLSFLGQGSTVVKSSRLNSEILFWWYTLTLYTSIRIRNTFLWQIQSLVMIYSDHHWSDNRHICFFMMPSDTDVCRLKRFYAHGIVGFICS